MRAETYAWPSKAKQGGVGGAGSPPAAPTNPWGPDPTIRPASTTRAPVDVSEGTVEQMQAQTDRHQQKMKEREARMLRMAATAAETGAATLEELHNQGEQLKHIRSEQAKIDENLTAADKLLTSLESWGGAARTAIGSWFSSASGSTPASARTDQRPSPAGATAGATSAAWPPSDPRSGLFGASARGGGGAATSDASARDEAMGQLSSLVGGLHAQALAMNDAIRDQNGMLDGTIASADKQQGKLDTNNRRAKKLIGR